MLQVSDAAVELRFKERLMFNLPIFQPKVLSHAPPSFPIAPRQAYPCHSLSPPSTARVHRARPPARPPARRTSSLRSAATAAAREREDTYPRGRAAYPRACAGCPLQAEATNLRPREGDAPQWGNHSHVTLPRGAGALEREADADAGPRRPHHQLP
jgi:hypothetical protein